jgi:hypothetical protein
MPKQTSDVIPTLTEVIPAEVADEDREAELENLIAELQTELAASTFALTERLLHTALSEMEATLFEQVSNRLRRELPELVDGVLRRHLESSNDTD